MIPSSLRPAGDRMPPSPSACTRIGDGQAQPEDVPRPGAGRAAGCHRMTAQSDRVTRDLGVSPDRHQARGQ